MRQYLISTDTTADLTDDFVRENSIDIHTLFYAFGEQLYGPGNEMPVKEFYTRMRNGEMPTTMACNPEDVAKIFKKRVAEGYDILHIAFSSALSSSYNNCCIAAREVMEEYPESKIIVIDSLAASMGEGLTVYRAIQENPLTKQRITLMHTAAILFISSQLMTFITSTVEDVFQRQQLL